MECKNCPYIKDEFDNKMNRYSNRVKEDGIPNSVYGYLNYEDASDEAEQCCWCEKTGGKIWWYGQCSDAQLDEVIKNTSSKRKKRNKRERDLKYKRHLKYISENSSGYPHSAYPMDKNGNYVPYIWFPNDTLQEIAYYKRFYRGSSSSYHKKMSNRKIRRYKGELPNGFGCHKLYDYWYEMY